MSDASNDSQEQGISPRRLIELSAAFQSSRIFLTGCELDVFSVLGDEVKTSQEVAEAIDTDPRGTDRLLNALCVLELLTKSGDKFANSPVAAQYLVKGKSDYDFHSRFKHAAHRWDSWTTLTSAIQRGGTVMQRPTNESGREWLEAFIATNHARAVTQAPFVVKELDLAGVSHVLDVGGGSGAFAIAFVRARDGLESTVFELPNVVPLTRGYIEREGLSDRIHTVPGNYHKDELGTGFDLALLSGIIDSNSFEQNQELFHKVCRALNPGGRIVISDFIMEDNRLEPRFGAFFALFMLVDTPGGDTYTESDIKIWMEEAGLAFTDRINLGLDGGYGLMIGTKK